jgi:hypothetical protein
MSCGRLVMRKSANCLSNHAILFWYFPYSCVIFCTATVHLAPTGRKSMVTVLKHSDIQLNEFLNLALPCHAVLRAWDVYPGSKFFPSQVRIFSIRHTGSESKNLSILTQKLFLSSRKYDPCCSSRIQILIFYPSRIPHPGFRGDKDTGSGSATQ